ncbi:MAG: hypothetical protein C0393_00955 [Anaerolinea sp.]|nr:hypothetical protein [Anaerolinea sp.]
MPAPDSIFEYIGVADSSDPLGLWRTAPLTAGVSFDVSGTSLPLPENPVWRVNLPADASAVEDAFRRAEAQMAASQQALEQLPDRLDDFAKRSQPRADGGVSFDAASYSVAQGTPEAGLLGVMDSYRALETGQVSFGVGELAGEAWEQAKVQFQDFMEQINREALHFAWVETIVDGNLVARTTVDWGGDSETVWSEDITPDQMGLHGRTLNLAAASRNLKLRMFTTITTGAAKIAVLLATPAGAVMALPAAYKYVNQILSEVREAQLRRIFVQFV